MEKFCAVFHSGDEVKLLVLIFRSVETNVLIRAAQDGLTITRRTPHEQLDDTGESILFSVHIPADNLLQYSAAAEPTTFSVSTKELAKCFSKVNKSFRLTMRLVDSELKLIHRPQNNEQLTRNSILVELSKEELVLPVEREYSHTIRFFTKSITIASVPKRKSDRVRLLSQDDCQTLMITYRPSGSSAENYSIVGHLVEENDVDEFKKNAVLHHYFIGSIIGIIQEITKSLQVLLRIRFTKEGYLCIEPLLSIGKLSIVVKSCEPPQTIEPYDTGL
jgi:hypothetical protein